MAVNRCIPTWALPDGRQADHSFIHAPTLPPSLPCLAWAWSGPSQGSYLSFGEGWAHSSSRPESREQPCSPTKAVAAED